LSWASGSGSASFPSGDELPEVLAGALDDVDGFLAARHVEVLQLPAIGLQHGKRAP
jgi:hypothetical protein